MYIRKGDTVVVLSGADEGKSGRVIAAYPKKGTVLVERIRLVKRHTKPNPTKGQQGGIIEKDAPMHLCKVALFNPGSKKGDRVRISTLADGKKVRVFKSNGENVDA